MGFLGFFLNSSELLNKHVNTFLKSFEMAFLMKGAFKRLWTPVKYVPGLELFKMTHLTEVFF